MTPAQDSDVLADAVALRRVDKDGMLDAIAGLPGQVREGARIGRELQPRAGAAADVKAVLFTGMGGSAMGAEVAALWLQERGAVPCAVVRDYDPPRWAGRGTLVVAVSYSGGTEETNACVKGAAAQGAHVLAVTGGGALGAWAAEHGADVVPLPGGLQPRAALGHLAFATLGALETTRLTSLDGEDERVALHLEGLVEWLGPQREERANPANRLARALEHRIALVYGAGPMALAARRLAAQLNENAEVLAHWAPLPEAHHNETVAWAGDARTRETCLPVVLRGAPRGSPLWMREEATVEALRNAGAEPFVVEAPARDDPAAGGTLAQLFHAIALGDYASVYLACLRGRDPTPVEAIRRLKTRLAAMQASRPA